jgi:hypothetical protein
MVAAGAICILLLATGRFWQRFRKAFLFGLLASLPVLVWLVWTYFSSAHSLGGRSIGMNWADASDQFRTFRGLLFDTVGRWVPFQSSRLGLTYRLRFILAGAGGLGILALSAWSIVRLSKKSRSEVRRIDLPIFTYFGLSALFFVAVLLVTYLFTRPVIDIDNRMLLPLFVCCVMTLYGAFALWQAAWSKEGGLSLLRAVWSRGWKSTVRETIRAKGWKIAFQVLAWLVAAACLVWYIPQARETVRLYHKGDGLTAYRWGRSEIIQTVMALPEDQPIISNDWQLLLLWTGRPIYGVWVSLPSKTDVQKTPYGTLESDPAQSMFCSQGAALVIFNDFSSQARSKIGKDGDFLFKGLTVFGNYPDGTIYLCP